MRKYDELYMAIKNDRKKSATPTFNQELLNVSVQKEKGVRPGGQETI
jgi:hypothetical protein